MWPDERAEMRPFSAYLQPVGSIDVYELEIRHAEQRYLVRRQGLLVGDWRSTSSSALSVQQLLDLARDAVVKGLGLAHEGSD